MNALSKITESNYNILVQEKNITNFESVVVNEFKRLVKEFIIFVDEKYCFYAAKQDKNEEETQRCEKFKELKLYISNPISQKRKIIGMAENKSNFLTVEFKSNVLTVLTVEFKSEAELKISIKEIEGAREILKSTKRSAFLDSAEGQMLLAEFIDRVFQRTSDGHFKVDAFMKSFQLEFENFSVLSWERALIHFVKSRPEKSPSFNEILTIVERYERSNIDLQETINFLAIFKK